ncbi:hypothetical protein ABPG77_008108 [Micractinium sp. CCAP 211/92]
MCNAQCGCVNMYLLHTVENLFATLRAMAFLKVAAALEGSLPWQDPSWVLSRADLAPPGNRREPTPRHQFRSNRHCNCYDQERPVTKQSLVEMGRGGHTSPAPLLLALLIVGLLCSGASAACDPGWTGAHCVLCDPANTTACTAVYAGSTCAVESPEEAFNATTVLKGYDDCSIVESTLEGMTLDQASLYGRCGTNLTGLEGAWACRLFFSATSPAADLKVELTGCTRPTDPPADGDLVVDCATVSPSCTSGCDPTTPPE